MNSELLLLHFDRIIQAPGAVSRLRQFFRDLAVRGKLVEQDPTEPLAISLVNELKPPRKKVAKTTAKVASFSESDPEPFSIPNSWVWIRLGDLCSKTGSGSTPRGGKSVYQKEGVPFLRSQNIYNDALRLVDVAYISKATHEKMYGTAVAPRDLLLNITGGSIGRCGLVPSEFGEANVSQHVAIIRTAIPGTEEYLHQLVLSPYFQKFVIDEQTGAGRGGLPKNKMDRIPVALPPLAEQSRIVERLSTLMVICDELEEQLASTQAGSAKLLESVLFNALQDDSKVLA
jgi:type I restriction enzyme S subunit